MVSLQVASVLLLLVVGTFGDPIPKNDTKEWYPECGYRNSNGYYVDVKEPERPGPFHDLTILELQKLREFLEKDPKIQAVKSSNATLKSSYIFTAELLMPKKEEVLKYLDQNGPQPVRQAHVILFRGDKSPPVVEECVCGPLPDISKCELLKLKTKRNPVEFSVRPLNYLELKDMKEVLLKKVDEQMGFILKESYGETFTDCRVKEECLDATISPVGTELVQDINKRLMWVNAMYKLPFPTLHMLDFSLLVNFNDIDASNWAIEKVWYGNRLFEKPEELVNLYKSNKVNKTKVTKPVNDDNLFSSAHLRGEPWPPKPQRPPRLVEPDGKRYSVKEKKVEYMDWTFNYRLSPLTGPSLYDIRYKGERLVYELALKEIANFHSGFAPFAQTSDDVESGVMMGSRSKSLVPGAGCPETATLLPAVFMNQYGEEPAKYEAALCLFENNDGTPIRRHLSYEKINGGFYGGMLDSAMTLRSAMTMHNNDYILDFIFHQNGIIETKFMSTGYIQSTFYTESERPYGHHIHDYVHGSMHQHFVNFKVDLDIGGTSNRYETLDIKAEDLKLTAFPDRPYSQIKYNATLKQTEKEALESYDFTIPRYHVVHNNAKKTKYDEIKAYRIELKGTAKNILQEGLGNEKTIPWTRHQLVVTKQKEDEVSSSSIYGMLDSIKPAVDFSTYYADNEGIVDEDLIFWITSSLYHIPHSEDLPITPTVGNHLSFYLMPHNYFPECPSMRSRDAIYINYKDSQDPTKGVKVERNGNTRDQCVLPKPTLEDDYEVNPDRILESKRQNPTDF